MLSHISHQCKVIANSNFGQKLLFDVCMGNVLRLWGLAAIISQMLLGDALTLPELTN